MKNFYTLFKLALSLFSIFIFNNSKAQPTIAYAPVLTGLNNPLDAVFAPGDGRMFIAQQNGTILIRNGSSFSTFASIGSVMMTSGGEQGLLSLAFHPDYGSNRYFFVLYTAATTGAITVARYRRDAVNPNTIEAGGTVLLSIPKPTPLSSYSNHNGGKIIFGQDGYLYISTGDGGSSGDPGNRAQDRTSLLGKMLRIDVNSFATAAPFYDIPASNPFASTTDGFADEIFSYGLRNPWRWSFDRQNGDFWIADVGQGVWEEINHAVPSRALGGNYGWRCYEGAHNYNTAGCAGIDSISPVSEYGHNNASGGYAVTGGYVYRGTVFPSLQGYYMAVDYSTGHLWLVRYNGTAWQTFFQPSSTTLAPNVAGFTEGPTGALYAINRGTDRIDSVIVTSTVPVTIRSFTVVAKTGYNQLEWESAAEINTVRYNIEVSEDALHFTGIGNVSALHSAASYDYTHATSFNGYLYYRLAIENADGSVQYSNIVRVKSGEAKAIQVYPTLITKGNAINIELNDSANELMLINTNGQVIIRKKLNGRLGNMRLIIPATANAGLYLLRITGNNKLSITEKIIVQ